MPISLPPMQVIGITGPIGAGKDTVGQLLQVHAGYRPIAFADALRDEVLAAFPRATLAMLTDRTMKELPQPEFALRFCTDIYFEAAAITQHYRASARAGTDPLLDMTAPRSPRQIMQWWGTEYRRTCSARYWVQRLLNMVRDFHMRDIAHRFAITDVRFPNEAQLVREIGGQLWQVHREGLSVAPGAHASETTGAAFAPDAVIDNSSTIDRLREQVLAEVWRREAKVTRVTVEIEA